MNRSYTGWDSPENKSLINKWTGKACADVLVSECGVGWSGLIDGLFSLCTKFSGEPVRIWSEIGIMFMSGIPDENKDEMKLVRFLSTLTCQFCGSMLESGSTDDSGACKECEQIIGVQES